jgi:SAM-dependent methyltransferase
MGNSKLKGQDMKEPARTEEGQKNTFFDHFSQDKPTKAGDWLARLYSKRLFEFANIQSGSAVLEIGPGRGGFADICISKGMEYWAIEPNEKMAEALEKRGVKVVRSIVPPIPEMGRSFDVVVMASVMEHMDTMTAALRLSKGIYNLLNPGGRFVIFAPDYANWKHHFFQGDFSHSYVTTWRRLEGLLTSAGFEDVQGRYQSIVFTGPLCYLISILASWLPFGWLDAMFLKSRFLHRLYKLQIACLRRVLVLGVKQSPPAEDKT